MSAEKWGAMRKQRKNYHRNHKGVCLVVMEGKTAACKAFEFPGFASGLFSHVRKQW